MKNTPYTSRRPRRFRIRSTNVKSADYWKYRLAHERAAHAATKKEMGAQIRELKRRNDNQARLITRWYNHARRLLGQT